MAQHVRDQLAGEPKSFKRGLVAGGGVCGGNTRPNKHRAYLLVQMRKALYATHIAKLPKGGKQCGKITSAPAAEVRCCKELSGLSKGQSAQLRGVIENRTMTALRLTR